MVPSPPKSQVFMLMVAAPRRRVDWLTGVLDGIDPENALGKGE